MFSCTFPCAEGGYASNKSGYLPLNVVPREASLSASPAPPPSPPQGEKPPAWPLGADEEPPFSSGDADFAGGGGQLHPKAPSGDPDAPIVQFTCFNYYCHEDEGTMVLQVMRIGNLSKRSEVQFCTRDASAKESVKYHATKMRLVFEPGASEVSVSVPLIDSYHWDPTLEFGVELLEENLVNVTLGQYLRRARVTIIDHNYFPSDRFTDLGKDNGNEIIEEVRNTQLFYEYLKLNWENPIVRRRTMKFMLVDQLRNLYTFLQLFLNVYLVDFVLSPHGEADQLLIVKTKEQSLILIIIATVVPFAFLHLIDFVRVKNFGVGSPSRSMLQGALLRKFLNYDQSARMQVGNGALIMAMTRDSQAIVSHGYQNTLKLAREVGHLMLMLAYQFLAPIVFQKPFCSMAWVPLVLCPLLMIVFIICRMRSTSRVLNERNEKQDSLVAYVDDTVSNYRLIADFLQRHHCVERFSAVVDEYNEARKGTNLVLINNHYFMMWLLVLVGATYTVIGGMRVVDGSQSLGMFLTNLSIFTKIGQAWSNIYDIVLEITTIFPALDRVVTQMNLPLDVSARKVINRERRKATDHLATKFRSSEPDATYSVDRMPIVVGNVDYVYRTKSWHAEGCEFVTVFNHQGIIEIKQSEFVCLVGPKGGGKATIVKIIGGEILPSMDGITHDPGNHALPGSHFFVPSHLRVLHVHAPLFFHGTLMANLVFGVHSECDDGRVSRVAAICKKLGVEDSVLQHIDRDECHIWADVLSATQCQLLSIARALITNPEVLCMHKPTQIFDDASAEKVTLVLREFVDHRGIDKHPGQSHQRRPRTCITTSTQLVNLRCADQVYHVSMERGICPVNLACLSETSDIDALDMRADVASNPEDQRHLRFQEAAQDQRYQARLNSRGSETSVPGSVYARHKALSQQLW